MAAHVIVSFFCNFLLETHLFYKNDYIDNLWISHCKLFIIFSGDTNFPKMDILTSSGWKKTYFSKQLKISGLQVFYIIIVVFN